MADIASMIARPPSFSYNELADPLAGFTQGRNLNRQLSAQAALAGGLPKSPDGQIDWGRAVEMVGDTQARYGSLDGLTKMATELRGQQLGEKASRDFVSAFTGGQQQPQQPPPSLAPGVPHREGGLPPASADPTMTISPRQVEAANAPSQGAAVQPSMVWGDGQVGEAKTLPPPGPVQSQNPAAGRIPALIAASSNPRLPAPQRAIAQKLLEHALKSSDMPETQKNYALYRSQGGADDFTTWDRKNKSAGATTINTMEGADAAANKARLTLDLEGAKEAQKQALTGIRLLPMLNEVERLATRTPGGWAGPISATAARALAGLGLPVDDKMSNAEVLQSISQRLVPIVREPGPTSERELDVYLRAVPGLMQSQEGRVKVVAMTRAMIDRSRQIAQVYRANLGKPDLAEKLAELDKPIIPDSIRKDIERGGTQDGGSVIPPAMRSRSPREQLNAAPPGSIAVIDGVRSEKQRDGTWKPINGQ